MVERSPVFFRFVASGKSSFLIAGVIRQPLTREGAGYDSGYLKWDRRRFDIAVVVDHSLGVTESIDAGQAESEPCRVSSAVPFVLRRLSRPSWAV
jgi:hypothetical protein